MSEILSKQIPHTFTRYFRNSDQTVQTEHPFVQNFCLTNILEYPVKEGSGVSDCLTNAMLFI